MTDNINHPTHYQQASAVLTVEPIELCKLYKFMVGSAIKYIVRAPYKGHEIEDCKKALWYLRKSAEEGDYDLSPVIKLCGVEAAVSVYAFRKNNRFINALLLDNSSGRITSDTVHKCMELLEAHIKELEEQEHAYELETTERIKSE